MAAVQRAAPWVWVDICTSPPCGSPIMFCTAARNRSPHPAQRLLSAGISSCWLRCTWPAGGYQRPLIQQLEVDAHRLATCVSQIAYTAVKAKKGRLWLFRTAAYQALIIDMKKSSYHRRVAHPARGSSAPCQPAPAGLHNHEANTASLNASSISSSKSCADRYDRSMI